MSDTLPHPAAETMTTVEDAEDWATIRRLAGFYAPRRCCLCQRVMLDVGAVQFTASAGLVTAVGICLPCHDASRDALDATRKADSPDPSEAA